MTNEIRIRGYLFSILMLTMCLATQGAWASVVVVGTCRALPKYPTIQLAVDSVPNGSTVYVCPGTYPEQVTISKPLTLAGYQTNPGDAAVVVPPAGGMAAKGLDIFGNPVAAQIFVAASGSVTIRNLTVDGTGNNLAGCGGPVFDGIYYQNTPGLITDSVVRNQFQTDFVDFGGCQNGLAINIESTLQSPPTVTVSANSVRAYQKNGVTASGFGDGSAPGPNVTIQANYIVGLAATSMNWPGGAAENGVQVGFGATGKITLNTINDNIWFADDSSQPQNAASGILIYASSGVTVLNNYVGSAQFGIVTVTDPTSGPADKTIIQSNKVSGTQIFDAIDACSSTNTITLNTIFGSAESAIHLDDSCGSGINNTVTGNTINEACAGILLGAGTPNTVSPNTFYNVTSTTMTGDVCPVPAASARAGEAPRKFRPAPYKGSRR